MNAKPSTCRQVIHAGPGSRLSHPRSGFAVPSFLLLLAAAVVYSGMMRGEAQEAGLKFSQSPVVFLDWNSADGQLYQLEQRDAAKASAWEVLPNLLRGTGSRSLAVIPADQTTGLLRMRKLVGQVTNALGQFEHLDFGGAKADFTTNRMIVSNVRGAGLAISADDFLEMEFERVPGTAAFNLLATRIVPDVGIASGAFFARGLTTAITGYNARRGRLAERSRPTLEFTDGPVLFRLRKGQVLVLSFGSLSDAVWRLRSPSGRLLFEDTYVQRGGTRLVQSLRGIYEEGDYQFECERLGGFSSSYELNFRNANSNPLTVVTNTSVIDVSFDNDELRQCFRYQVRLEANEVFRLPTRLISDQSATVVDERSVSVDTDTSDGVTFVADRAGTYYLMLYRFNARGSGTYRSAVSITKLRRG